MSTFKHNHLVLRLPNHNVEELPKTQGIISSKHCENITTSQGLKRVQKEELGHVYKGLDSHRK